MIVLENKVILELSSLSSFCNARASNGWFNFVQENVPDIVSWKKSDKIINKALKKYHAKLIRPRVNPAYIRFASKKYETWFLLEWS
jgi:hypothetical protein